MERCGLVVSVGSDGRKFGGGKLVGSQTKQRLTIVWVDSVSALIREIAVEAALVCALAEQKIERFSAGARGALAPLVAFNCRRCSGF